MIQKYTKSSLNAPVFTNKKSVFESLNNIEKINLTSFKPFMAMGRTLYVFRLKFLEQKKIYSRTLPHIKIKKKSSKKLSILCLNIIETYRNQIFFVQNNSACL